MYEAVVIGTSAGGMRALKTILPALPKDFPLCVAIVQHIDEHSDGFLAEYLDGISAVTVKDAEDKEPFRPGTVYLAPAGYHLLVEYDRSLSLSIDARVNYCCPSIDVLFESAADVFRGALIGVVLTGGNSDGSAGLRTIKTKGGCAIVQNPATAETSAMPKSALGAAEIDYVSELEDIALLLVRLGVREKGVDHDSRIAG